MSDLLDTACEAFKTYLKTTITDKPVYNGKRTGDIAADSITVDAVNAEEDPTGSGNFHIDIECIAKTMAPTDADGTDPKTASDALTESMLDLLEIDNDSLMAAVNGANFTVMGFEGLKQIERANSGDAWITTWRRRIYCGGFTDN